MSKTEESKQVSKFDPSKKQVVKALTLPVLSTKIERGKDSASIYFFAASPIRISKSEEKDATTGEIKSKDVHVMNVINLLDEKPYTVVLSAVALGQMEEGYSYSGQVGKCFELTSHGKENGKKYNTITLNEIKGVDGVDYEAIAKSFGVFLAPANPLNISDSEAHSAN